MSNSGIYSRKAGELLGRGILRIPGRVWGIVWAINCTAWTLVWAFVAGAPAEPGFRELIAAGAVISALTAFACVGKAAARGWDGRATLGSLFSAWHADAASSRFRAVVTVLPLVFVTLGLAGLPSETYKSTAVLLLALGVALFIWRGIGCGYIVGEQQGTEYSRTASFVSRTAAVLGIDPSKLDGCLIASPDRTVTIRPVPPQAIAHIPSIESQLALHMPDYEVNRADVEAIVLVPASAETIARRQALASSGGLVSGVAAESSVSSPSPTTVGTPDWANWEA